MIEPVSSTKIGAPASGHSLRLQARRRAVLALIALAYGLGGCAVTAEPGPESRPEPHDEESWYASQRPILQQRAEARWAALMRGDMEKAYEFTSPDYRAVATLQQFRGKYGRTLEWRVARAIDVIYDSPTVATVPVEVAYQTYLRGMPGNAFENKSVISEKWIYRDSQWWYTVN